MAKYSTAVTTEGTIVWPQMRMMRPYSRMTIVLKPIQRTSQVDRRGGGGLTRFIVRVPPACARAAQGGCRLPARCRRGPRPGA